MPGEQADLHDDLLNTALSSNNFSNINAINNPRYDDHISLHHNQPPIQTYETIPDHHHVTTTDTEEQRYDVIHEAMPQRTCDDTKEQTNTNDSCG